MGSTARLWAMEVPGGQTRVVSTPQQLVPARAGPRCMVHGAHGCHHSRASSSTLLFVATALRGRSYVVTGQGGCVTRVTRGTSGVQAKGVAVSAWRWWYCCMPGRSCQEENESKAWGCPACVATQVLGNRGVYVCGHFVLSGRVGVGSTGKQWIARGSLPHRTTVCYFG
jgi:hypothetical protein